MADWALWAETSDENGDDAQPDGEPADIDASLEARRLARWLRAMFGGSKEQPDDSDR